MLTKVLEATPNDVEVLIDLAQLLEGVDPHKSLTLYENACDLIKTSEDGLQIDPPAAILNNIGALHMTLENYERAKEYFEAAEAKLQEDLEGDLCDSKLSSYVITMRYNLARCLEHLCLFEDAEVLYKGILREQENYTDCYLRLGCLARDRGQIYESSVWFKEAMSVGKEGSVINVYSLSCRLSSMAGHLPACVIDNGTGYTKLGYAGNCEPQFIIPSAIAVKDKIASSNAAALRWNTSTG
ncbi:unnamed protein product [Cylicocyclus nassatus]|uniref:Uncharacterized protein n=2 Tax=Cylicocyclus nassatus TaxID=53992 RepID=A0AA36GPN3_CYLNA|nr:unnamed protein product [Cylicocyclus nassatus]